MKVEIHSAQNNFNVKTFKYVPFFNKTFKELSAIYNLIILHMTACYLKKTVYHRKKKKQCTWLKTHISPFAVGLGTPCPL